MLLESEILFLKCYKKRERYFYNRGESVMCHFSLNNALLLTIYEFTGYSTEEQNKYDQV